MIPMRRPTFHRLFASLGLTAMLLLSVLPTLGRLAGAQAVHGAMPATHDAMHSLSPGMSHAQHMAHMSPAPPAGHAPDHDAPASGEHAGHDCSYCALLAGLASVPGLSGLPAALHASRSSVPLPASTRPVELRTSCLGSRGPPTLLKA
jgi:hypothetical protein